MAKHFDLELALQMKGNPLEDYVVSFLKKLDLNYPKNFQGFLFRIGYVLFPYLPSSQVEVRGQKEILSLYHKKVLKVLGTPFTLEPILSTFNFKIAQMEETICKINLIEGLPEAIFSKDWEKVDNLCESVNTSYLYTDNFLSFTTNFLLESLFKKGVDKQTIVEFAEETPIFRTHIGLRDSFRRTFSEKAKESGNEKFNQIKQAFRFYGASEIWVNQQGSLILKKIA